MDVVDNAPEEGINNHTLIMDILEWTMEAISRVTRTQRFE